MPDTIARRAYEAFRADLESSPAVSLRGGNAVDGYAKPPPRDAVADAPTDEYLERYALWGLAYPRHRDHAIAPHVVVDAPLIVRAFGLR